MSGSSPAGSFPYDGPMTEHLTIVAIIRAAAGQGDAAAVEIEKLVAPTRVEAGCLQYDLHRDNVDPDRFLFYETWASRPLWQDHMNSDHIAAYKAATAGLVESVEIFEMTRTA